jgi:hypothetical protein
MENQTSKGRLLPDSAVRARYNRTAETLRNWERDPRLNFPKAKKIRKRNYRDEAELDRFDREQAAKTV